MTPIIDSPSLASDYKGLGFRLQGLRNHARVRQIKLGEAFLGDITPGLGGDVSVPVFVRLYGSSIFEVGGKV